MLSAALLVGCEGGGSNQTRPVLEHEPGGPPGDVTPPIAESPGNSGDETLPPESEDTPEQDAPSPASTPDTNTPPPVVSAPQEDPPPVTDTPQENPPPIASGPETPPPPTTDTPPPAPTSPPAPRPIEFPTVPGWRFYGPKDNAPTEVLGVTEDDDGNLWVAGGEQGLFVLRKGASTFQRFTLADGLHPYGYLTGGKVPKGDKYLNVRAVTGGKGSSVYVGYQGIADCEENFYAPKGIKDANHYKSGDADRVTLKPDGKLSVVHYDISSGKGVVGQEAGGREKVCSVLRIAYDRTHNFLWFGANHAFAWGDPDYAGDPLCEGKRECSGVMEHTHPYIDGLTEDGTHLFRLTDAYWGIAVRPDGDVWFGGANRTTRFKFMTILKDGPIDSARFELARKGSETTGTKAKANRLDIWPDATNPDLPGGRNPKPSERLDDNVSSMALMADNTLWVGSFSNGLAQLDEKGTVLRKMFETGGGRFITALARDPSNESLWVGFHWGDGIARLKKDGTVERYNVLGWPLQRLPVHDIQVVGSGPTRRVLFAFGQHEDGSEGGIGIYEGE